MWVHGGSVTQIRIPDKEAGACVVVVAGACVVVVAGAWVVVVAGACVVVVVGARVVNSRVFEA